MATIWTLVISKFLGIESQAINETMQLISFFILDPFALVAIIKLLTGKSWDEAADCLTGANRTQEEKDRYALKKAISDKRYFEDQARRKNSIYYQIKADQAEAEILSRLGK